MLLKTEQLTIRELTVDDVDALALLLGNKEVMHFSVSGALTREQTKDYLEERILSHYAQFGFGLWAVIHSVNQRLIGYAGLMRQSIDGEELIELGYRLDPEYWGKGLATEAARAISEYAFDRLDLDQIISIIDPQNSRSIALANRIGMHYWKDALFHKTAVQIYRLKKITVAPFDSEWAERFAQEEIELKSVFKDIEIAFFHIGSTSIPRCSAKPVIDILGVTSNILDIDRFNQKMMERGFNPLGEYGMKQRRFFLKKTGTPVHCHIFESSDPEVGRHLRFCRYLRSHPDKVQEYSELKKELSTRFSHDIRRYILGKEKFIKGIDIVAAWEASPEMAKKELPKRKEWTQEELLHAMEVNMHLQMTYFAKYIPTMELVFEPDVTVIRSQISDDTFNYILSAHFTESRAKKRVIEVLNHFKQNHLPFSWWVGPSDTPSDLDRLLLEQGLSFKEKNIGMYLEISQLNISPNKTALIFQRVESPKELKHFADIIVAIGGSPHAFDLIYSKLPPILYCGNSSLEMYVAYCDNVPTVTGILVTHANVAGIYYVATLPEQRNNGFGTAMMEYLLHRAQVKGYFIATLQASSAALSLYERLGFKECCQFLEYAPTL